MEKKFWTRCSPVPGTWARDFFGRRLLGTRNQCDCCPNMARVLLVEDYQDVRTLLCEAAKDAGHSTDCVETMREAEDLLSAGLYDLVICSVVLPDGSGVELAVKAADLGMGTVVMSGQPDSLKAMTIAGVTCLKKPFTVQEFRKLIDDHLGA